MTLRALGTAAAAAFALIGVAFASPPAAAQAEPEWQHGLAMHGDLKYGPDFEHFDYVNPNAPKGGTVRSAAIGTFDSLNPFIIKGNPGAGLTDTYDTLMVSSDDEPFSQYGLVAEAVRTPEDRNWVEFRLREEAKFHDGEPMTPEDVIWTFNTLKADGAPFYRFYYSGVDTVRQTGERTVRFDFKEGLNRELPLILGQLPVLPKHYWEGKEFNKTTLEPPLGSGPYKVADFEPGRRISFQRVEDWWAKDLAATQGMNNFGRIEYDYYRDSTVVIEAFKAGQFDFRMENSSKDWATAYDTPALKKGLMIKREVPHQRTAGMQGFAYNLRRDLFKDPRVREALAYAFDFAWSNENLFYGQYTRTRSYFDNSELAARGLPSEAELKLLEPLRSELPPRVFTEAYQPPTTKNPGGLRANLREASRLLKEAGWEVKGRQLVNAETGRPFKFELLLVSPLFERIALPFAKNLERLGIEVTVRTIDTAQYRRRLDTYDFDMVVASWGQSQSPGNEQLNYWGSESATHEGSQNYVGIQEPAIDKLIRHVISAETREDLVIATRALDRALQWGFYVVPHWHIPYDRVVYWDKFGYPEKTPSQGIQFDAWWIVPDKESRTESEQQKLQQQ